MTFTTYTLSTLHVLASVTVADTLEKIVFFDLTKLYSVLFTIMEYSMCLLIMLPITIFALQVIAVKNEKEQ